MQTSTLLQPNKESERVVNVVSVLVIIWMTEAHLEEGDRFHMTI